MSVDADWHKRLNWLADLMIQDPDKMVRKLQWEALKYYPLHYKECIRGWMKMRIAFLAADLIIAREKT
jgi:hypothetical protein